MSMPTLWVIWDISKIVDLYRRQVGKVEKIKLRPDIYVNLKDDQPSLLQQYTSQGIVVVSASEVPSIEINNYRLIL